MNSRRKFFASLDVWVKGHGWLQSCALGAGRNLVSCTKTSLRHLVEEKSLKPHDFFCLNAKHRLTYSRNSTFSASGVCRKTRCSDELCGDFPAILTHLFSCSHAGWSTALPLSLPPASLSIHDGVSIPLV